MRGVRPVIAAALLLGLMGCQGNRRHSPASASPPQTEPPTGDTVAAAAPPLPDGGSISTAAEVPADFPKDVPIYRDSKVIFSAKSTKRGRTAWSVTMESGDARDAVAAFYKAHMPAFTLATSMDMGDTTMCIWQGTDVDVTLMVMTQPDQKTNATLTVTGK
jgi:hypothetical protein